ncbi:MAG: ABC transporter ATP-binding protein [bacterium]
MSGVLKVENLTCGYSDVPVLKDISFEVKHGDFIGVVGPNGSGKTTLLRAIAGLLNIHDGNVLLKSKNLLSFARREIARHIAFISQLMEPVEGLSVEELIMMGRTPYIGRFAFEGKEDHDIVEWAIKELKVNDLRNARLTELSGGEFQRVAVARALAQKPKIMLLDEPTSHLDIRFQMKVLRILRRLRRYQSIICTFHDLNIASKFCARMILLKKGKIIAFGSPEKVLTQENIWNAYRIKAEVKKNPKTKRARYVMLP